MIEWVFSWLFSMLLLAVLVGAADRGNVLEKNQAKGAVILFALPTILEVIAFIAKGRPLWF